MHPTPQFSAITKNTNMVLNSSQRIFVNEEYFRTTPFDLCSERLKLKLPGVYQPSQEFIESCTNLKKQALKFFLVRRRRTQEF